MIKIMLIMSGCTFLGNPLADIVKTKTANGDDTIRAIQVARSQRIPDPDGLACKSVSLKASKIEGEKDD